jgi:hypothetical protein
MTLRQIMKCLQFGSQVRENLRAFDCYFAPHRSDREDRIGLLRILLFGPFLHEAGFVRTCWLLAHCSVVKELAPRASSRRWSSLRNSPASFPEKTGSLLRSRTRASPRRIFGGSTIVSQTPTETKPGAARSKRLTGSVGRKGFLPAV